MRRSVQIAGLLVLLAQPCLTAAHEAAAAHPATDNGMASQFQRPSRRTIRATVRQTAVHNTQRISITDVPLDRTFSDSGLGVKVQYPSSWQRQDLAEHTPPLTLVVMFLSNEEHPNGVRQNINLVVEELASPLTLAQYTDLGVAMEREFFENYAVVQSDDILLAGLYRAHRVIFTASLSGGDMTFEQIWTLRGNTAHVWTFADSAEFFTEHVKTFEKMMDTLTVR